MRCAYFAGLHDNSFPFQFRVMAKVDEQAKAMPCGVEIIDDLGAVLVRQRRDGFQLDQNLVKAHHVGHIALLKRLPLVRQRNGHLRAKRDVLKSQLQFQAFLIHALQKPTAFLFVNLEARSDDALRLVFVNEFAHESAPFVCLVCFVGGMVCHFAP